MIQPVDVVKAPGSAPGSGLKPWPYPEYISAKKMKPFTDIVTKSPHNFAFPLTIGKQINFWQNGLFVTVQNHPIHKIKPFVHGLDGVRFVSTQISDTLRPCPELKLVFGQININKKS